LRASRSEGHAYNSLDHDRCRHLGMNGANIFVSPGLVELGEKGVVLVQCPRAECSIDAHHRVNFSVEIFPGRGRSSRDGEVYRGIAEVLYRHETTAICKRKYAREDEGKHFECRDSVPSQAL